ncbi:MAG: hypothetical protein ABEN55_01165 [Bradymonadaceae bacterium]
MALDNGTDSGALMHTVSNLLDRVEQRRAEPVSERVAAKFSGIANVIGEGVRSFFYKGNETVVEKLTPVFDLGMGHPEVLARRPDFADQIFQTGVILVRAYINLEQREDAAAVAQLLARRLPGMEPAPSTAPPNIIRFFREQRKAVADGGATLRVEKVGADDCTSYVNGSAVGNRALTVAAEEPYYLTVECGDTESPVWKRAFEPGEEATVSVSAGEPLEIAMKNANFQERKRAEDYLRLVSEWTGIPQVLGVKQPTAETEGDSVLVVRVGADGEASWSDTSRGGEVNQAIARVMPDYQPAGSASNRAAGGRHRWLDWTLAAGGVAILAGGTAGGVLTENRAHRIQCSTGAASSCAGVTLLEFDNSAELRRAERQVNTARAGYISALAVGAGLTTWGTWRLLQKPKKETKRASNMRLQPGPGPVGVSVHVRW